VLTRLAILVTAAMSIAAPAFAIPAVPVPEPASMGLVAVGIGALAFIRRRNRR
jgi:hypothetical protein